MREWYVRGALAGALALVLVVTALARLGLVEVLFERPEGTFFWTLSRASGATAMLALTFEVFFGLLLSTGAADRLVARARSVEMHQWLSTITLSLIALHAVSLIGDRWAQFDALDVLVPFVAPYRPIAVALGVIAAHVMALVHLSFRIRRKLGPRGFRLLHFVSFPAFGLAAAHALLAGTDAGALWMKLFLLVCVGSILWLTFARVASAARGARLGSS